MKRLILSIFLLVALGFASITGTLAANTYSVTTIAYDHGSVSPSWTNYQVAINTPINVIAIPDPGWEVDYVTINNNIVTSITNNICFDGPVLMDMVIKVYFKTDQVTYTINATAGPNGNIAPSGIKTYIEDDEPCFNFYPDNGYEIDQIIVDGNPISPIVNPYCFDPLNANHNIQVTFKEVPPDPEYYDVTITWKYLNEDNEEVASGGITSNPTQGVNPYLEGTNVTVNFVKQAGGSTFDIYEIVLDGIQVYYEPDQPLTFPTSWNVTPAIEQDHTLDLTFKNYGTGIQYIEIPSLAISPNPVSEIATITKDADVIFTHIEIVDIMGNTVLYIANPTTDTIDLSLLPIGGYIVRFHTEKGLAIRSIIKK